MADTINPKAIQKIRVGSQDHPIDAVTIEGKAKEDIGDLVTEIDGTSTDLEYPSAKCMYDIIYGREPVHDYSQDYLTFDILTSGNIVWVNSNTIQYSKNEGSWTNLSTNGTVSVNAGDSVRLKGTNVTSTSACLTGTTCSYNVSGNIMSLFAGDNFTSSSATPKRLSRLFQETDVIDASHLTFPENLGGVSLCFAYLFQSCSNLVYAPSILPAMNLTQSCYSYMFQNCTSLITAPVLPATTLPDLCYAGMFRGCTSLTKGPDLLAPTLTSQSYTEMFYNCTSLNYIKCLATTIRYYYCSNWTTNVAASGTFVKSSSNNSWRSGVDGIPSGWTVQDA